MFRIASPDLSAVVSAEPNHARYGMARVVLPALVLMAMTGLLILGGCGGKDDSSQEPDSVIIATVGDHEITDTYYRERLTKLKMGELPRNEDGTFKDMASLDGKEAFLEVIISKELLYLKALDLGYENRETPRQARIFTQSNMASRVFEQDEINGKVDTITDEELEVVYERLGDVKVCDFIMTYDRDDIFAAKKMMDEDGDWDQAWAAYNKEGYNPAQSQMSIPAGRFGTEFENVVFSTPDGGVSEVFEGDQGYWLFRVQVTRATPKPSFEEAKEDMLDIVYRRKLAARRKALFDEVLEERQFVLNDETLAVAFAGMAEGESIFKEDGKTPRKLEELTPLDISVKDLDLPFYSYLMGGELLRFTLGDYKNTYDGMSVFKRPKKSEGIRAFRTKLLQELSVALMNDEAVVRGYHEDPRVLAVADAKVEEIIVGELYKDVVTFDDQATRADIDAYWAEHKSKFILPEGRAGLAMVCTDLEKAAEAHAAWTGGGDFAEILDRYCVDPYLREQQGATGTKYMISPSRFNDLLFNMEINDISLPTAIEGGYALVQLLTIDPPRERTLTESMEIVKRQILQDRENKVFEALLTQWREQFPVKVYEDRLVDLPSWKELQPEPDTSPSRLHRANNWNASGS